MNRVRAGSRCYREPIFWRSPKGGAEITTMFAAGPDHNIVD